MSIIKALDKALKWKKDRGWDKLYWAIDVHDTILRGNYTTKEVGQSYYPDCLKTLKLLSEDKSNILILYTSSHPRQIEVILDRLNATGINFDYTNENPEVEGTELCNFSKKFYFNILIDDKAGFDPYVDWNKIYEFWNKRIILNNVKIYFETKI